MTTDDAKLACYDETPDRYVLTSTATATMTAIRNARSGKINLGSLKAECRKFARAYDAEGLTGLRNSLPADDLYHRDFVQGYITTIQEGRKFNL